MKDYTDDPAAGARVRVRPAPRRVDAVGGGQRARGLPERRWSGRPLQRRAMAADFSWRAPATEYVALYRGAVEQRATPTAQRRATRRAPRYRRSQHRRHFPWRSSITPTSTWSPTAIRTGRESPRWSHGYTALLELHEKYRSPISLHLSGTLIEAVAWHHPGSCGCPPAARRRHPAPHRRRLRRERPSPPSTRTSTGGSCEELFWLYRHHLGCAPEELDICWIPERVWDTEALAGLLAEPGRCRTVVIATSSWTTGFCTPPTAPTAAATASASTGGDRTVLPRPTHCGPTRSRAVTDSRSCRCRPSCDTGCRRTTEDALAQPVPHDRPDDGTGRWHGPGVRRRHGEDRRSRALDSHRSVALRVIPALGGHTPDVLPVALSPWLARVAGSQRHASSIPARSSSWPGIGRRERTTTDGSSDHPGRPTAAPRAGSRRRGRCAAVRSRPRAPGSGVEARAGIDVRDGLATTRQTPCTRRRPGPRRSPAMLPPPLLLSAAARWFGERHTAAPCATGRHRRGR